MGNKFVKPLFSVTEKETRAQLYKYFWGYRLVFNDQSIRLPNRPVVGLKIIGELTPKIRILLSQHLFLDVYHRVDGRLDYYYVRPSYSQRQNVST